MCTARSKLFSITALNTGLDGTSIYLTRDIGGAIERYEQHKFDKMLYVISSQQDLHTAQFIKMLNLMEFPWAQNVEHVNYGLVLGMSTRKGTVVFLEQIIREAASVMHEQMKKNEAKYAAVEDPEQTSLEVGLAAIKIQDMAAKRYVSPPTPSVLVLNAKMQDKQLQLQLGPHDVFRGRHRSILAIRTCPVDLANAQEPRITTAPTTGGDRGGDARGARCRARDCIPVGYIPGRRSHRAAYARAERCRHVCVPPRACDIERVGDRRCQGRGGRRARAGAHVAVFVCAGRAWRGDAVVEHPAVGADVRRSGFDANLIRVAGTNKNEGRNLIKSGIRELGTIEDPHSDIHPMDKRFTANYKTTPGSQIERLYSYSPLPLWAIQSTTAESIRDTFCATLA